MCGKERSIFSFLISNDLTWFGLVCLIVKVKRWSYRRGRGCGWVGVFAAEKQQSHYTSFSPLSLWILFKAIFPPNLTLPHPPFPSFPAFLPLPDALLSWESSRLIGDNVSTAIWRETFAVMCWKRHPLPLPPSLSSCGSMSR